MKVVKKNNSARIVIIIMLVMAIAILAIGPREVSNLVVDPIARIFSDNSFPKIMETTPEINKPFQLAVKVGNGLRR